MLRDNNWLDIDGNTSALTESDGIPLPRAMLGFTGAAESPTAR